MIILEAAFSEGTLTLSPASCVINNNICNKALQHVESSAQIELVYDEVLFSRLLSNDSFKAIIKTDNGDTLFTGLVQTDTSWQEQGAPLPIDKFALTIKDYTSKLHRKTAGEIALVDTSLEEIVTTLAANCGIDTDGIFPDISIPYFVVQKDREYLGMLDALCFQYCQIFYFDQFGKLRLFDFSLVPDSPDLLSGTQIIAPMAVKKSPRKYSAVKVSYNTLTVKDNELVYRDAPRYGTDDQPQPVILQPGVYYPFDSSPVIEAADGKVEQSFASGFAQTAKKHNGELVYQRSKGTSLLYTSDHQVVEDWEGSITIDRTDFSALGAALRLRNDGSGDAKLWQFAIRAKAVYRNAAADVTAGYPDNGEIYTAETEFVFESFRAKLLAGVIYRYFSLGNYQSDFTAEELIPPGSYRRISLEGSGYQNDVLITGYAFDASKELYAYKALSVSQATAAVSGNKTSPPDGKPYDGRDAKPISYPRNVEHLAHINFDEQPGTVPAPTSSYTAWQSNIIQYDVSGQTVIQMSFDEALSDVIILSGTLSNNLQFRLYFDGNTGNGAKDYQFVWKMNGEHDIVISSDVTGSQTVTHANTAASYGEGAYLVVDHAGDVHLLRGAKGDTGEPGAGVPAGGTEGQVVVRTASGTQWMDFDADKLGGKTLSELLDAIYPVGCTYAQYPGGKTPLEMGWPGIWNEQYQSEGVFFRTPGGEALAFNGGVQDDAIRNITGRLRADSGGYGGFARGSTNLPDNLFAAEAGSSGAPTGVSGYNNSKTVFFDASKAPGVKTANENRPKNRTFRVWRRTA